MKDVQSNLSDLAQDAAEVEREGGGFMEPGKKRRGRKKLPRDENGNVIRTGPAPKGANDTGPSAQSVAPTVDPTKELRPLTDATVKMYSNVLVMYAEDQRAELSKESSEALSEASAVCLNQYFPNTFGKHAALIMVGMIVSTSAFSAWVLRRENLEKLREEKRQREMGTENQRRDEAVLRNFSN